MLKVKRDISQQDLKIVGLSNLNVFNYLKMWIVSARHDFKWAKSQIN